MIPDFRLNLSDKTSFYTLYKGEDGGLVPEFLELMPWFLDIFVNPGLLGF